MTHDPQSTGGGRDSGRFQATTGGGQPFAVPTRTPRLRLGTPAERSGCVDGAWWPRTDNLTTELHDLISVLTTRLGATTRIAFDWNSLSLSQRGIDPPDGIEVTGPLPDQPSMVMYVFGPHNRCIRLLVIDPAATAARAEAQMRDAVSAAADHSKP
ncbi:DUF5994 family protein [Nocardia jinanensis]|uniref:Uncharacterized protein n=1 Tax=Nocardia jinanensis TaxID=382504 RepID=A0A917VSP8_9NOCA|nr:DUF5994 family protein [Nocardia jinanensis]GGL10432.1 hypothetical protein GCM10011588_26050 [Nocardia jinanensis]